MLLRCKAAFEGSCYEKRQVCLPLSTFASIVEDTSSLLVAKIHSWMKWNGVFFCLKTLWKESKRVDASCILVLVSQLRYPCQRGWKLWADLLHVNVCRSASCTTCCPPPASLASSLRPTQWPLAPCPSLQGPQWRSTSAR